MSISSSHRGPDRTTSENEKRTWSEYESEDKNKRMKDSRLREKQKAQSSSKYYSPDSTHSGRYDQHERDSEISRPRAALWG